MTQQYDVQRAQEITDMVQEIVEDPAENLAPVEKLAGEFLSFEQIAAADDISDKVVPIPEWGGNVLVRSISKRKMDLIRKRAVDADGEIDDEKLDMMIFCTGLVNPKITAEQYEVMRDKSMTAWNRIYVAIKDTSKIGQGDDRKAEEQFSV